MPDFGNRFVNVARDLLLLDDNTPVPETDQSEVLRIAIVVLMTTHGPLPGGTVYLRPGRWLLGGADPLVIPPEVTLLVAPGAVIVPLNPAGFVRDSIEELLPRPALEIRGSLDVGLGMFIATRASELDRDRRSLYFAARPTEPRLNVGWVSFPTPAVEALYPEWWGADSVFDESERPAVDTDAMEAALRSALFRTTWDLVVANPYKYPTKTPLPIEIRTQVRLNHSLWVGGRPWTLQFTPTNRVVAVPGVSGLTIRGRRDSSGAQIVGAAETPQVVLLFVVGADGLRLEDLWLDAGRYFETDLLVVFEPAVHQTRIAVVDCKFSVPPSPSNDILIPLPQSALVWALTSRTNDPANAALPAGDFFRTGVWSGKRGQDRLSITGCRFVGGSRANIPLASALLLDAEGVAVDVTDSTFTGSTRTMISVLAGELKVDTCSFANALLSNALFAATNPGVSSGFPTPSPGVGLDVEVWEVLLAPVKLTLTGCTSTSPTFLWMNVRGLYDVPTGQKLDASALDSMGHVCSAVVSNLFHQPAQSDQTRILGALLPIPPAIYWGSRPADLFSLTLIGGRLLPAPDLDSGRRSQAGMVAVAVGGNQRIYDAWLLPLGHRYEVWNSPDPCTVVTLAPRTP